MINQSRRILCSWQGIKERRVEFVIRSLAHVTISHLYDLFTKGEKKKRLVRVNFVIASLSLSLSFSRLSDCYRVTSCQQR